MSTHVKLSVLRRRAEFLAVAASGKKWVSPGIIFQFSKTPDVDSAPGASHSGIRYGLTASSKIGNAVIRNRARRRMRALVNAILSVSAKPGYDFVFIARFGIEKHDTAALRADILRGLKRLDLLRGP